MAEKRKRKGLIDDGYYNEGIYGCEGAAEKRRIEKIARFESEVKERRARGRYGGVAWGKLHGGGIAPNLVRFRELRSEVRQRWGRSEKNRCEERMRFERAATRMKMRRMENDMGIELNDDGFWELESEVEQRWDKSRCEEYPTRFETLIEDARRRQQKRGCERRGEQIKLRKMEHATRIERKLERFEEPEREVWDSLEENCDIRRQQKRDSERSGARIKLQKMEIAARIDQNLVRFGELERQVREGQDSWEKNHAEKRRFETQKGDDTRRKQKRDSERAAELIKLQKMEDTAKIEENRDGFRELEILSGCTLSFTVLESQVVTGVYQGSRFWNPLAELGLKLKDECYLNDDDDAIFEEDESHLEESYGDSDMIVEEKSRNSTDNSMPLDDKALRSAMLKGRYSQIILKAQQKTLFN